MKRVVVRTTAGEVVRQSEPLALGDLMKRQWEEMTAADTHNRLRPQGDTGRQFVHIDEAVS